MAPRGGQSDSATSAALIGVSGEHALTDPEAFPPGDAVRRWLAVLGEPERLVDPVLDELLRLTGRMPVGAQPAVVGRAGKQLLVEVIERLRPARGDSWQDQLTYRVLRTCYLEGVKAHAAVTRLGVSERQLSRVRSRAASRVHSELISLVEEVAGDIGAAAGAAAPVRLGHQHRYRLEPIPTIIDFHARHDVAAALSEALRVRKVVHIHGPAGIGKTCLVADVAAGWAESLPVLWYRVRTGVNDTLPAVLFEVSEHLRGLAQPHLAEVMSASLPQIDASVISRVAVSELDAYRGVLVFDDYQMAEADPAIGAFLDDVTSRLAGLRIVTVGRHQEPRPSCAQPVEVPPLTVDDTRMVLRKLGADVDDRLVSAVHEWTGGISQLVALAAAWLRIATEQEISTGMIAFTRRDEVQAFLLDWLTGLMDSYDWDVLEAAAVFRVQFTDAAVAHLTGRTVGQISDVSRRLVRNHIASRGRDEDVAFVHNSIRDYIYHRLPATRRRALHTRAADWYRGLDDDRECVYHEEKAREGDRP